MPKPRCETLQCAAAFCSARVQARTLHGAPSSCSGSARAPRTGEPLKPLCVLTRLQLLPSRAHHTRTGLSGAPDLPTALCSHPTPFALSSLLIEPGRPCSSLFSRCPPRLSRVFTFACPCAGQIVDGAQEVRSGARRKTARTLASAALCGGLCVFSGMSARNTRHVPVYLNS